MVLTYSNFKQQFVKPRWYKTVKEIEDMIDMHLKRNIHGYESRTTNYGGNFENWNQAQPNTKEVFRMPCHCRERYLFVDVYKYYPDIDKTTLGNLLQISSNPKQVISQIIQDYANTGWIVTWQKENMPDGLNTHVLTISKP